MNLAACMGKCYGPFMASVDFTTPQNLLFFFFFFPDVFAT